MLNSWTASSQITGISKDQKIEIVSTLISYPLVLNELDLTNKLLDNCKEINEIYTYKIVMYKENENLYKAQISNLEQQKKLFDAQLKKSKNNQLKLIGIGLATVVTTILIK